MASMIVSDELVLCKAALVFAVTRCLLSFALKLVTASLGLFSSSSSSSSDSSTSHNSTSCNSAACLRMVKDSLSLTTLGAIEHRLPETHDSSCAVCLNKMKKKSQVWELSNCNHVFHKQCLDTWLCYDDKLTCPLCRASLLPVSPLPSGSQPQPQPPSWAVERMLYLFGDDLLP